MQKHKHQDYFCRYCGTEESILDKEDKIKIQDITAIYCPICLSKGKKRKMLKVITNEKEI